ncbi:UDP-Glycosyltransferase superfamily protein isoform 1 [Hibiscus syriacus]|uniref:UDP-Glycosyltransferase superfamily protein isoform 1 n=1 Tax=Hibiscus syriacus TaxID=106335 RepID=A0A6A2WMC8_HIBSY|nr:UDP-Glycosyltransferase superfamily protein isoform 1 [Hibiscus syriacus]
MLETIVIHFTRLGKVGTGTVVDLILVSSGPAQSQAHCPTCTPLEEGNGVASSCLNCFLAGGILYRFEYAVNLALFIAKARGGTCTLAVSDPDDLVVHRTEYLLENGFGCGATMFSRTTVLSTPLRLVSTNIYGMAATAVGLYCVGRYAAGIGVRRDAVKISVEDLTRRLATGLLQVIEPQLSAAPAH